MQARILVGDCGSGEMCRATLLLLEIHKFGDFPGGPVAKAMCSQWRRPKFNSWSGNWIPRAAIKGLNAKTKDAPWFN